MFLDFGRRVGEQSLGRNWEQWKKLEVQCRVASKAAGFASMQGSQAFWTSVTSSVPRVYR